MSLKKAAISGIIWTFVQQFSTQLIAFGVSIVLARLLLPAEFGLIAMIGIFIGLGNALINGGLTQSLIRSQNLEEIDYATVFYFNLVGSVVVYLIVFFGAPYVADFYGHESLTAIIRVLSVNFIINAFAAVQATRLTKIMDFKTLLKVSVPSLIIASIVGISMAYKGYGVWSLVASAVVKSIAGTIQLWFWAKWTPIWAFSKVKFKQHFNFGFKLMLSSLLDIAFSNAYAIIIGKFFAPAQVGYFSRADTLQQLPVQNISTVLGSVTFPLFAKIQDDDIRLRMVYKKIMQMVVFIVSPTVIIMAFLAEPLFRFLFTEKWLPAVPYFQILCVNGILFPIHQYNLTILKVKGYSNLFLKLEIIKKVIIVIIVTISFQFGIFGLLYGSVVASILLFFINTHYSGKFLNYTAWAQIKDLLPIIFTALIAGVGTFGIDYILKGEDIVDFFRLVFGSTTGVLLYISMSYIFKISSLNEVKYIILKK
jgi:O-antigen/teichoic acid export membrane protein